MQLSYSAVNRISPVLLWVAQHPALARTMLVTVSLLMALAVALATQGAVFACSPHGGGGGGCGG